MDAYSVKRFQIVGLPGWGDSGRDLYDIAARIEGDRTPTLDQVRRMLQTLLADRFQLKLHHETRVIPVYALVGAKNGPRLTPIPQEEGKPPALACEGGGSGGRSGNQGDERGGGAATPIDNLGFLRSWDSMSDILSMFADRPVIDKTGFKGPYCTRDGQDPLVALDVAQLTGAGPRRGALVQERSASPDVASGAASIFTQVEEKWSLKLESQKGPVDILVIDRAERPSEN